MTRPATGETALHTLRVDFDADSLTIHPECYAPAGAPCRLVCTHTDCGLDAFVIFNGPGGTPYHGIERDDGEWVAVHSMKAADRCLYVEAFEWEPLEQNEERQRFTVGRIPIAPEYDGDRFSWTRATGREDEA